MALFREETSYQEKPTPFAGFIGDTEVKARSAPHVLVSGVSGSGKSRRVLMPSLCMWDGPVVAVSSKPDLIDECLMRRLRKGGYGRTFILDLSGEVPDRSIPDGVEKVIVDPVALIQNDDDALDLAAILIATGSLGAGDGKGGGGNSFWATLATAPLAAILRAAGDDLMPWARDAVNIISATPVDKDEDGEDLYDPNEPCWANAIERLQDISPLLAKELTSAAMRDTKMRDSIAITMSTAVAPWLRSNVLGRDDDRVFIPKMLEHEKATLFMVTPATGVAAGAAVAVTDFITKRWRANQTEETLLPRLLLVVDEVTNCMPWPKMPVVVTESRAMGIHLLIACQSSSQFAKRYGTDGMKELRDVFPATLVLIGAPEKEMLEAAAWWSGKSEKQKTSIDATHRQSQSSEKVEHFTAHDLLPKTIDEGRLLRGSLPHLPPSEMREVGVKVRLKDISEIPEHLFL